MATRKHRIGIARIMAVMENADVVKPTMTKRDEPGTFYQGYDNRGREIELIVVEGEDYTWWSTRCPSTTEGGSDGWQEVRRRTLCRP